MNDNLTIYAVGGAGINVATEFRRGVNTPVSATANIVGLDTSDRNVPKHGEFEVELMRDAQGGGKFRATNVDKVEDFVDKVLIVNKPSKFNIVVFGTSGGTGGVIGPVVVRELIKQNLNVVAVIIGDTSSQIEINNTVKCFQSLDSIRSYYEAPINFTYIENGNNTRGEVNAETVNSIEVLTLLLTDKHDELDYEDIHNFLYYSRVVNVPPVLGNINIFNQNLSDETLKQVNPVASASLFENNSMVRNVFEGLAYKATGIFSKDIPRPTSLQEIHYLIDHGQTVKRIFGLISKAQDREGLAKDTFVKQKELGGDAKAPGIVI